MGLKPRANRHSWISERPGLLFALHVIERCEKCGLRRQMVRRESLINPRVPVWEWGYTDDMRKDRFVVGDGLVPPCAHKGS